MLFFRLVTNDFLNHERYKRKKFHSRCKQRDPTIKKHSTTDQRHILGTQRRHINLFSRNSRPFSLSPSSFSLCFHSTSTSLLSLWRPLRQFLPFPSMTGSALDHSFCQSLMYRWKSNSTKSGSINMHVISTKMDPIQKFNMHTRTCTWSYFGDPSYPCSLHLET